MLIAAIIVVVTQLGGNDEPTTDPTTSPSSGTPTSGTSSTPTSEPSGASGVMSADGATALIDGLKSANWTCFDSLSDPVPVKRCFLNSPDGGGTTSGKVSLQYTDTDNVGAVTVSITSPSTKQSSILSDVAGLVGDNLLAGNGTKVQQVISGNTSESSDIEGVSVSGSDSSLYVYSADYDYSQIEAPSLPPLAETRKGFENAGLRCSEDGGTLSCEGDRAGISLRVITAMRNGEPAGGWSVSASPATTGGGSIKKGAEQAATLLKDAGLIGDDGAGFITDNPVDGQSGDFGGFNIRIITSESGSYYSLLVTVDQIR